MIDEDILERMRNGWKAGGRQTKCGLGSTLEYTEAIREELPKIIEKYDIKSIADIGAGDLNWIAKTDIKCDFKAYDIFPRKGGVIELDITQQAPEYTDLIICRDVLIHLTTEEAIKAIDNIKASCKYALLTSSTLESNIELEGRFRPVNMSEKPFCMGTPLSTIDEVVEGKFMGLYKIKEI